MSNTEIIFQVINSSSLVAGLILIIFGWIIPYRQSLKRDKLRQKNEVKIAQVKWQMELVDKQISSLYGPLYALSKEGDILFNRVLQQLNRRTVFPKDKTFSDLSKNDQQIWKHYVDVYKIPNQMKMARILQNNLHLAYNSEIAPYIDNFFDYCLGWELLDNQMKSGIPNYYDYHYSFNYPKEFDRYIKRTLDALLEEQLELTGIADLERQGTVY